MKIFGKVIERPEPEVVVIPRQNGNIVFRIQAIVDYEEFENLCPRPQAPTIMKPGGEQSRDVTDEKYIESVQKWATYKSQWLIMQSLAATEGIEWETVDLKNPETWDVMTELKNAGFSDLERIKITEVIYAVNGLSEALIDKATADFLAGQGSSQKSKSSQNSELPSTESGEPVKE